MSTLDEGMLSAVANGNAKVTGELSTAIIGTLLNDVVLQSRMANNAFISTQSLSNANMARAAEVLAKRISELDLSEAAAKVKLETGFDKASQAHDVAKSISVLSAAVANTNAQMGSITAVLGQLMKGVELTPPYRPGA
jgi:hypothetical protein